MITDRVMKKLGVYVLISLLTGCGEVEVGGQQHKNEPTLEQVGKLCARMCWPRQNRSRLRGVSTFVRV